MAEEKGEKGPSWVWKYFTKEKSGVEAVGRCKTCSAVIIANSSTLARHLGTHKIKKDDPTDDENPAKRAKLAQSKISSFLKKESMGYHIAKMAATDGFSFRAITNSDFIRKSFSLRGIKLPKCESDVVREMMKFAEEVEDEARRIIDEDKRDGKKFSITVDEWTNIANHRFLDITLIRSGGGIINLGLVRLHGSCTAERLKMYVKNHLEKFGIDEDRDIVAATGDGASVMKKFGRINAFEYIECLNHGVNLGLVLTLYKKKSKTDAGAENDNESCEDDWGEENLIDVYDDDADDEADPQDEDDVLVLTGTIDSTLKGTRAIVKYFKKSALKLEFLEAKIRELSGDEASKAFKLPLDVRTRWNSILPMGSRVLQHREPIEQTLEHYNSSALIDAVDFTILQNLVDLLEPIEMAILEMSKREATFRTVMVAIEFVRDKLEENSSELAQQLLANLNLYINKRLNPTICNLMTSFETLEMPSAAALKYASSLLKRLFGVNTQREEQTDSTASSNNNNNNGNTSRSILSQELKERLSGISPAASQQPNFDKLKEEFKIFKSTGNPTPNISKLIMALNTIKPTSTESERTFAVAGNFCTKLRSRLSDKTLSALVFLKYYFKNPFV